MPHQLLLPPTGDSFSRRYPIWHPRLASFVFRTADVLSAELSAELNFYGKFHLKADSVSLDFTHSTLIENPVKHHWLDCKSAIAGSTPADASDFQGSPELSGDPFFLG